MKKITKKMLARRGACLSEATRFEMEWPDGAEVNLKNARRALELGLNIEWFASRILKGKALNKFIFRCGAIRHKCNETCEKAYNDCAAEVHSIREWYTTYRNQYDKLREAAERKRDRALATAFVAAIRKD